MLSALVLGGLALVPGLPLALVVGRHVPAPGRYRHSRRLSGVAVEGLLLGLGWYVILALVLVHAGWYGRLQVVVPTVALCAALARPALHELERLDVPRLTPFAAFLITTLTVAAALREAPFYFLYQVGDFGEYVNRANVLADGGELIPWFTHGFSVALSLSHLALGEAQTVALMPFLGLLLIVVTVSAADRLGAGLAAQGVVAAVIAVGVVPVWFSRLPASEGLYAVLQIGVVMFVVDAVRRSSPAMAGAAGVLSGMLLLVRGNGVLLVPIVVFALAVAAFSVRPAAMDILTWFAGAALLALVAAFLYNAHHSHDYFVHQLARFVPDDAVDQLVGGGGALPRLAVLLWLGTALWVLHVVNRRVGPVADGVVLPLASRLVLPVVIGVATLALIVPIDSAGLLDGLRRFGFLAGGLGIVGLVTGALVLGTHLRDHQRAGVLVIVPVALAAALLYAYRLPQPRAAPYYLYWDRYLFSELFPVAVLSLIWAVWALERGLRRLPSSATAAATAVLVVVLVGALVAQHQEGAKARQHRFLGDAYEELQAVDELADADLPLVYVGMVPGDAPVALEHPNTHRVVALPLAQTFDRRFLNIGLHPLAPDPLPSVQEIARLLAREGADEAYLVQVAPGARLPQPPRDDARLLVRPVGRTSLRIPMLDRAVKPSNERWREARLNLVVSRLRLAAVD